MIESQETTIQKTILVVEDDEINADLFRMTITQETPHRPLIVTKGCEALQIAQAEKPDLFILDYYLSDMTGIELYQHLRNIPGLEHIPTIMISARIEYHNEEIKQYSLVELGKPFALDEFIAAIGKSLA